MPQVNLLPSDRPQDVYAGVRADVEEKVATAAAEGDEIAKQLVGLITRKVCSFSDKWSYGFGKRARSLCC